MLDSIKYEKDATTTSCDAVEDDGCRDGNRGTQGMTTRRSKRKCNQWSYVEKGKAPATLGGENLSDRGTGLHADQGRVVDDGVALIMGNKSYASVMGRSIPDVAHLPKPVMVEGITKVTIPQHAYERQLKKFKYALIGRMVTKGLLLADIKKSMSEQWGKVRFDMGSLGGASCYSDFIMNEIRCLCGRVGLQGYRANRFGFKSGKLTLMLISLKSERTDNGFVYLISCLSTGMKK
ncbi:hypothetical protein NE237_028453 [Protea cynaroides]|uniref:Uncharacterized protein n=1 Tax=Protea cynaroides TaxID=273540 RepID=A0A9Q0GPE4_9MAGN|nr:hypothetical protein NE237_028453 [Protea cynaroides]